MHVKNYNGYANEKKQIKQIFKNTLSHLRDSTKVILNFCSFEKLRHSKIWLDNPHI